MTDHSTQQHDSQTNVTNSFLSQTDQYSASTSTRLGVLLSIAAGTSVFGFALFHYGVNSKLLEGVHGLYAIWSVGMIAIPILCVFAAQETLPAIRRLLDKGHLIEGNTWRAKARWLVAAIALFSGIFVVLGLTNMFLGISDRDPKIVPSWAYAVVNITIILGLATTLIYYVLVGYTPLEQDFALDAKERRAIMNRVGVLGLLVLAFGYIEMYANASILGRKHGDIFDPSDAKYIAAAAIAALAALIGFPHFYVRWYLRKEIDSRSKNIPTQDPPTENRASVLSMIPRLDTGVVILIVTVTPVETKSVLETFGVDAKKSNPQSLDGRVYFDLGMVNGARIKLTRSEMGAGGLGASQQAIQKGIATLRPVAVIMVGIAFGVNDAKQSIGDILVTERLRPYDLQRVGTAEDGQPQIILRDDKPHASPWLLNLFRSSEMAWEGARLRFGTLLTGAVLVDNLDFRDQLRAVEQEAIGGEMEGAGLYVACHDQKVDWILVKAICDWADGQKAKEKDQRQTLAAKNAAAFVSHAIRFASVSWEAHAIRPNAAHSAFAFHSFSDLSAVVCRLLAENRLIVDALEAVDSAEFQAE